MLTFIVMLIVVGLIAGAIARLLMPGRDPIGLLGTILLGVAGSFVGGFLENLLFYHKLAPHRFHFAGIIGSIIGAFLVLLLVRASGHERGRSRTRAATGGAGSDRLNADWPRRLAGQPSPPRLGMPGQLGYQDSNLD